MPNPLNRVCPRGAGANFAPGIICELRPALALHMQHVLSSWAFNENDIGKLIATVLGAESVTVIEKVIDKPGSVESRKLLAHHASQRLNGENLDNLTAVISMMWTAQRKRNPLAHWLSGVSAEVPEGILLANPVHHWRWYAQHAVASATSREGGEAAYPAFPRDKIQVYVAKDFEDMLAEGREILHATHHTNMLIATGAPQHIRDILCPRLLSLPLFREALDWTRADRLKPHESPPE